MHGWEGSGKAKYKCGLSEFEGREEEMEERIMGQGERGRDVSMEGETVGVKSPGKRVDIVYASGEKCVMEGRREADERCEPSVYIDNSEKGNGGRKGMEV